MKKSSCFDYEVREDDASLKSVREKEKFFGFSESKPLDYDEDYLYLWDAILNDSDIVESSNLKFGLVSKNYLRSSLQIYDKLGISLHDVNCARKKVKSEKDLKNVEPDEILEFIPLVNPGKIPFHILLRCGGNLCLYYSDEDDKAYPFISFDSILLPPLGNKTTACFYLHEIAHTQIIGINRGIKNILNSEMIPNFIDQIAAMEIDPTGRVLRNLRYDDAKIFANALGEVSSNPNLSFGDRLEDDTFVQSVLEATNLANIYFGASPLVKREILGDVNRVFNGEMFTEEMLSKYESGIDAVPKDVKVFKKI